MYNQMGKDNSSPISFFNSDVFVEFLKRGINRHDFIVSFLKERGVSSSSISFSTGRHILVNYPKQNYNTRYKQKIFIAHYDRLEGTEGANDNSAAVFILMNFALYLSTINFSHNIKIIFTDGEEAGREGLIFQGSYKLALGLRELNMEDSDIYIYDMCGRGDTLIFSLSGIYGRDRQKIAPLLDFHNQALSYAIEAGIKSSSLITAYSDNAGFIAAGLKAQLITVLPYEEVNILKKHLENPKDQIFSNSLIDSILKNKRIDETSLFSSIIPNTWQKMHTPFDTLETLTDFSYNLVMNYMKIVARKLK